MQFEPKDVIAIYAAVIATLNVGWSIWRYIRDQRRNELLESKTAHRDLSVKHIRFRLTIQEIRRRQNYLNSKIPESDVPGRARLKEIGELFPNLDVFYLSDKAIIERADKVKTTLDRLRQEPMHKRIDELLEHVSNMQAQLIEFEQQQDLGGATNGTA